MTPSRSKFSSPRGRGVKGTRILIVHTGIQEQCTIEHLHRSLILIVPLQEASHFLTCYPLSHCWEWALNRKIETNFKTALECVSKHKMGSFYKENPEAFLTMAPCRWARELKWVFNSAVGQSRKLPAGSTQPIRKFDSSRRKSRTRHGLKKPGKNHREKNAPDEKSRDFCPMFMNSIKTFRIQTDLKSSAKPLSFDDCEFHI